MSESNPLPSVSRQTTNGEYVMSDFRMLINGRLVRGADALAMLFLDLIKVF
jgi:hypothetical protein